MRKLAVAALAIGLVASGIIAQTNTGFVKITFAYPPQATRLPVLKAWLLRQEAPFRAGVEGQARADARDAAKEGRPFIPYESSRDWKTIADTPRFLSLSVERYDFSGGAHGMTSYGTTVWDKDTSTARTPLSFFTSPAALRRAIRPAFCHGLDAERRRKRGGTGTSGFVEFDACIDPLKETIILGSASRDRFDRIGILVAPYDAGPYAEGSYEVTLPVTATVLAAVRPQWRRYFTPGARSRGTP